MSDREENGVEEYKVLADELKDQGNQAFQAGDVQGAINLFTQAINLDPDNHVYYSNRAAAYMKADSKSKALHDAEKCVELAPTWAKGYSRLAAAQQSLKRFDAAMDNFKKCIEFEPNNKSYWASLKACQEAFEADKKVRFAAAQRERDMEEERLRLKEKVKKEMEAEKERQKQEEELASFLSEVGGPAESEVPQKTNEEAAVEDDLLADFFSAVSSTAEAAKPKPADPEPEEAKEAGEEEKADQTILTEKYSNQDLGDGRAQVERLLARHHEWRNLNPYYVLQLGPDATEEDIKLRYKKLSLKVHPDRLRDLENARDAFEQVKEAYQKLMDETQKKNFLMHIENATLDFRRERRRLLNKGIKEEDLPDAEEALEKHIMKHFAEIERMRRRAETNLRNYSARDKMQEAEEQEKMAKHQEFDKNWGEENRREKRVGNWRDFQSDPTAKKVKAAFYKEETREEVKHGVVKTEAWRKNWK